MSGPSASVVVVSRGRPGHLARCLTSLAQQYHRPMEIVVVADPAGVAAAAGHALSDDLKVVEFDRANISAARNAGLEAAAGEVVAFIDDDAVAEPLWLTHLVAPLADPGISAAGGVVLGRNGISVQWGPRRIQRDGHHADLPATPGVAVFDPPPDGAIKTEGTNCAFRRDRLEAIGGFDEAFRFYLDEAEVNMRLAAGGARTALVSDAVVHHVMAPSDRRLSSRCPRDMHDIGASVAAFLARHGDPACRSADLAGHRASARNQMLRHMVAGTCAPGDVDRVLAGFDEGAEAGRARASAWFARRADPPAFRSLPDKLIPRGHRVMAGRGLRPDALIRQAEIALHDGYVTTVFCFSRTTLYHRARMTDRGIWVQTGGLFGRSERNQKLIRLRGLDKRVGEELERVRAVRVGT